MIPLASPEAGLDRSRVLFEAIGDLTLREFFYYVPATAKINSPLLVLVHGITRRAAEQVFRFRDEAETLGVVLLAPYFSKIMYGQYQQVVDRSGVRADLALLDMIAYLGNRTGCATERVHMFGYSGGAQFAHRFALIHPGTVRSLSIASAGWYTMPDASLAYPYGIGTHPVRGMTFDLPAFLALERHVYVGSQDRQRDVALRQSRKIDRMQGRDRVDRARSWFAAMNDAAQQLGQATNASFEILEGVGHSFNSSARRKSLPSRVTARLKFDRNEEMTGERA